VSPQLEQKNIAEYARGGGKSVIGGRISRHFEGKETVVKREKKKNLGAIARPPEGIKKDF